MYYKYQPRQENQNTETMNMLNTFSKDMLIAPKHENP
jgi:hypothetical protein